MIILGIETSCDETSAAIIEGKKGFVIIKESVVASSLSMHAKTGGVIPEVAARAQLKFMLPVLEETLKKAFGFSLTEITTAPPPIDAIAVTKGPGLIGSLLIGLETARALSFVWKKPVVPVNHMMGHVYANFIKELRIMNSKLVEEESVPEFPLIALVVSGGHTDLLYMKGHGDIHVIGGTRDDAAGEAFDKIGRLLGLPYPGGAVIEQRAKKGDEKVFHFPRPLLGTQDYDFSFSGLKTAVMREVKNAPRLDDRIVSDIAAGAQMAIVEVLVKKTLIAAEEYSVKSILLSGGVSANQKLREAFQVEMRRRSIAAKLFFPPKDFCTDNAAMIAAAAYFNYHPVDWRGLQANPELYYE